MTQLKTHVHERQQLSTSLAFSGRGPYLRACVRDRSATPWVYSDRPNSVGFAAFTIGIGGKSGAGKSSLVNKLLGQEIFMSDDVQGCTRSVQSIFLRAGELNSWECPAWGLQIDAPVPYGLLLTDLPGIGEHASNEDYERVHLHWAQRARAFLYLVKADDRALEVDERLFRRLKGIPNGLTVGLSQVDRLEPYRDWVGGPGREGRPGQRQQEAIQRKTEEVAKALGLPQKRVVPFSGNGGYNLKGLAESLFSN